MKIQDMGFLATLLILLLFQKPKVFILVGLTCFLLAMPLFAKWIFFTGERLVWYGAAFVTLGILYMFIKKEKTL